VKFDAVREAILRIIVFWDVMPFSMGNRYLFGDICSLHNYY